MSAANVISLARSRAFSNFVFPLKFKMSSSSGKMTIASAKLPLYLERQPLKLFDKEDILTEEVQNKVKESFKVFSDPSIFEDGKPRFTIGAFYNAKTKTAKLVCYTFVKSGKGIRISHLFLTCEDKEYPNSWYFFVNFGEGDHVHSIAKDGISDEDISSVIGSGMSLITQGSEAPELSAVLGVKHDL